MIRGMEHLSYEERQRDFSLEKRRSGGLQVPTKAALSLPSSTGQEKENRTKGLWVKIRAGRGHSLIAAMGKPDSTWKKLI